METPTERKRPARKRVPGGKTSYRPLRMKPDGEIYLAPSEPVEAETRSETSVVSFGDFVPRCI
jgi:hypothetical protein